MRDISNAERKSQSSERSVRKIEQMKRDSAFEQKTRIAPSRDTSGISQNIFFSYNQRKKQSRAQTDNFGTYSTSFWKVVVSFSVKSPNIFRKVCTKSSKQLHTKQNDGDHVSKKIKSCLFYYSVLQDISNAGRKRQGTERSVRKRAQQNVTLRFNKKHVFFHVERSQQVLNTAFLFTTKESSRAELKKTLLERT